VFNYQETFSQFFVNPAVSPHARSESKSVNAIVVTKLQFIYSYKTKSRLHWHTNND